MLTMHQWFEEIEKKTRQFSEKSLAKLYFR